MLVAAVLITSATLAMTDDADAKRKKEEQSDKYSNQCVFSGKAPECRVSDSGRGQRRID